MISPHNRRSLLRSALVVAAGALMVFAAFWRGESAAAADRDAAAAAIGAPLRLALATHAGATPLDDRIRAAQEKVRERADVPRLEHLAALFVNKARRSGDPGYYTQAEACANAMPEQRGAAHAGALIRGHVRHALHDFAAAETIARQLVEARGMFLDHGLLGDVMLDCGRLDEAAQSYQRMIDLKPGLQSYARAAELRWRRGDVAACRELLATAVSAGSRRDPESLAWVLARRGALELQCNDAETALQFADEALAQVEGHPAALVVRGRAAAALGRTDDAVTALARAARLYPLPEHLWGHADVLHDAGRGAEAVRVEAELRRSGEREDPRTLALWLATRGEAAVLAQRLAEQEFALRQDASTLDVLALARLRSGDLAGADAAMRRVLGAGAPEARFYLHAALIADATGDTGAVRQFVAEAQARAAALWPSERLELLRLTTRR